MKQDLIYKMLFSEEKVELSSEKVELKNVKELEKGTQAIFREQRVLDKKLPQLEKLMKEVDEAKKNLKFRMESGTDLLNAFEKSAKELGLSPDGVNQYKQLQREIDNSEDYLK